MTEVTLYVDSRPGFKDESKHRGVAYMRAPGLSDAEILLYSSFNEHDEEIAAEGDALLAINRVFTSLPNWGGLGE